MIIVKEERRVRRNSLRAGTGGQRWRRLRGRALLVAGAMLVGQLPVAPPAAAVFAKVAARTWGTDGRVLAILPVGDRVFVAGDFSRVIDTSGTAYPALNVAAFSATTGAADLSFKAMANNTVTSLATDAGGGGTNLFLGGTFGTIRNGATVFNRVGLAAVDLATGTVSPSWSPSLSVAGQADDLEYDGSTNSLYAVGNFTSVTGAGGIAAPAPFVAKIDASTGEVDATFSAAPDNRARAVALAADGTGRLFIGGDFTKVSGASRTRSLTAVDRLTGAVDPTFVSGPTNLDNVAPVQDITVDAQNLYVAATGSGGGCTALRAATGQQVWSAHANGNMQSVRLIGSALYCGGHFAGAASFMGADREKLAAVVAATGALLAFNPRINSSLGIWSLGAQAGDPNLYAGGDFTAISGQPQLRFAQFIDSTRLSTPQPPVLTALAGDGSVSLSWSVPSSDGGSPLKEYRVYRSTTSGSYDLGTPLAVLAPGTTAFTDIEVVNETTYSYVVSAANKLGAGAPSAEATATPSQDIVAQPPGPPTFLAIANPPGKIQLDWNPPSSTGGAVITAYRVYRGTSLGSAQPYATVPSTSFVNATDVVAGTTYYYMVSAVNSTGESSPTSEVWATLVAGVPDAPELSGVWNGSAVVLSWTVPPDGGTPILKYQVLRDAIKVGLPVKPPKTEFVDSTAAPGPHVYQVKAINAQGAGKNSNRVTVEVPGGG